MVRRRLATDLQGWAGNGPTNRDLHPVLEYSSPLGYYDAQSDILPALAAAAPPSLPADIFTGFGPDGPCYD